MEKQKMKEKIKQYFYDSSDLRQGRKCPNDYPFWYFLLLDIPLDLLAFVMLCVFFGKAFIK